MFAFDGEIFDKIPHGELARRMPGLQREFGKPSDKPLIPCVNVDMQYLPVIDGVDPASVVSVEHAIVPCHCCGDDVWIGPKQAKLPGTRTCYLCVAMLNALVGALPEPTMLDPKADEIPRRLNRGR